MCCPSGRRAWCGRGGLQTLDSSQQGPRPTEPPNLNSNRGKAELWTLMAAGSWGLTARHSAWCPSSWTASSTWLPNRANRAAAEFGHDHRLWWRWRRSRCGGPGTRPGHGRGFPGRAGRRSRGGRRRRRDGDRERSKQRAGRRNDGLVRVEGRERERAPSCGGANGALAQPPSPLERTVAITVCSGLGVSSSWPRIFESFILIWPNKVCRSLKFTPPKTSPS